PFPVAQMQLPDPMPPRYETLSSIGGHEINFLMRQQIHTSYYMNQYAFADELIHGVVQDLFYPLYTFAIAFANPEIPDVWINTRGDPVEYTLSVYKKQTGRDAIMNDGSVDPELVSLYRQGTYLGLIWPLLNPLFYRSLTAFGADMKINHGLMPPPRMFGNDKLSWSWGTHFNPSPLGYELYMINYFLVSNRLIILSLKSGRPYKNNGIGIHMPSVLSYNDFHLGISLDGWDQDIYGLGGSMALHTTFKPASGLGFILKGGLKSSGYLIGRRVDQSAFLQAGCSYSF
ncbi:hypothetical protein ACFLT1_09300, partial [Bacteroidota bacterium]